MTIAPRSASWHLMNIPACFRLSNDPPQSQIRSSQNKLKMMPRSQMASPQTCYKNCRIKLDRSHFSVPIQERPKSLERGTPSPTIRVSPEDMLQRQQATTLPGSGCQTLAGRHFPLKSIRCVDEYDRLVHYFGKWSLLSFEPLRGIRHLCDVRQRNYQN